MEELLKGKTVIIENSECEIGCVIIVDNKDVEVAKDAIRQALNIWLNHEDSDEHVEDLNNQIAYVLNGRGIKFYAPYSEEVGGDLK